MADTLMRIVPGATYRRTVTWNRTGVPSDYASRLVVRRVNGDQTPIVDITDGTGVTLGGTSGAISQTIKIAPSVTSLLPVGNYAAALMLRKSADATENWVVTWDARVRATALGGFA